MGEQYRKKTANKYILFFICLTFLFGTSVRAGAEIDEEIFGEIRDDTYENAFIGYGCKLPGWHFYTEEEIAATYQLSKEAFSAEIGELIESAQNITVMGAEDATGQNNLFIQVQYAKQYIPIYSLLGIESLIDGWGDQVAEYFEKAGMPVISTEKTKVGEDQHSGLKMSYMMSDQIVFVEQTCFIRGDFMVYISATSFGEDATKDSLAHFYSLSSSDLQEDDRAVQTGNNPGMEYTDTEINLSFMIPQGWQEDAVSNEGDTIKAEFVNRNDGLCYIMYLCMDVAGQAGSDEDEIMLMRSLSETLYNKDTFALMLGKSPDELYEKKYGDYTFYSFESEAVLGKQRTAVMQKNGYIIMFMLQGFSIGNYSDDFETLLASVTFQ